MRDGGGGGQAPGLETVRKNCQFELKRAWNLSAPRKRKKEGLTARQQLEIKAARVWLEIKVARVWLEIKVALQLFKGI